MQRDFDSGAVASQGLIHGVIDNFPETMHQAARVSGADVHSGALTNSVKAF